MVAYTLYGVSFVLFLFVCLAYFFRNRWVPHVSTIRYNLLPSGPSSFQADAAAGLHSSAFDLSTNIEAGDERSGLDEQGKREVQRIMKSRGVNFDEARRIVMLDKFRQRGIGEDGRPRDPKFVSFS